MGVIRKTGGRLQGQAEEHVADDGHRARPEVPGMRAKAWHLSRAVQPVRVVHRLTRTWCSRFRPHRMIRRRRERKRRRHGEVARWALDRLANRSPQARREGKRLAMATLRTKVGRGIAGTRAGETDSSFSPYSIPTPGMAPWTDDDFGKSLPRSSLKLSRRPRGSGDRWTKSRNCEAPTIPRA